MKEKNIYYRRQVLRCLRRISRRHYVWTKGGTSYFYDLYAEDLYKLSPKMRDYAIKHLFFFSFFCCFLAFLLLFFFCLSGCG